MLKLILAKAIRQYCHLVSCYGVQNLYVGNISWNAQ